jgi:anaerobic magnesium-protoporphyrin IX monomethyl ester cyclase
MTRLLFGQSYFLRFDPKLWEAMQPYPPLGTLYAASFLREAGYSVALFDAMLAGSEAEWAVALDREKPDLAVLYEDNFNYLTKMCLLRMREAAFTMAGMAAERGIPIVVAGSDASDHAESFLAHAADYVLIGEGELTLCELADALTGRSAKPLDEIAGLAWKETGPDGEVRFRVNPRRPDIRDLDALPFPAWDLVDVERYRKIWLDRHGYFSMNMVTTRGCPFHCNWCAKPIWGQRYNSRSPQNVAEELLFLKEKYAPDHIWFADDILGLKPGWLAGFASAVDRLGAKIPFKSLSRVDLLLRPGETEALAAAGAEIVWVGAESGSQKILTAMEKGTQVEQIYEAARALRKAGVRVGFFLQFGYPGETREDIEATFRTVREILPDDIGMSVSYPLPGTSFFERVRGDFGEQRNWVDSNDLAMLYRGPFTTEFYRQLHTVLHKDYRMRKTWQALRGGRLNPRRTAAMVYQAATLPFERRKLDRLAKVPHRPVRLAGESMPIEESATPTPQ